MLQVVQGLAVFFLVSQVLSGVLLAIGLQFDEENFERTKVTRWRTRPGLLKAARLFSNTESRMMRVVFLLSLIFVVMSYAALLILAAHVILSVISG